MLSVGPIPRHVAFIMDGNRRWADAHGYDKDMHTPMLLTLYFCHILHMYDRQTGHKVGYEKMKQVLQWCMDIGCKVCTVFAFSIENFRRSSDEVSAPTIACSAMPCACVCAAL